MSNIPVIPSWSRITNIAARTSLAVIIVCGLTTFALHASLAQSVGDIVKKMVTVYKDAKAYQCTLSTTQNVKIKGKANNASSVLQIKYKSPNLMNMQINANGNGVPAGSKLLIISDGKSLFQLNTSKKEYVKQPAPALIPLGQLLSFLMNVNGSTPGLSLLPSTKMNGRDVYVIESKPQIPPNLNAVQKKKLDSEFKKITQYMHYFIDKQNYQMLGMSILTTEGMLKMNIDSQVVGGVFPPGAFNFIPPPGAKEITPQMPNMGGAPGPGKQPTGLKPKG